MNTSLRRHARRAAYAALILAAATLRGCGGKTGSTKPGQALASVNGAEVTVLQLNEELQRAGAPAAGAPAAGQDAAGKQLLQALIDRQLLQEAAAKENLDRDPKVMQAVDRARALIVAQAYLQKHIGNVEKPSATEIEAYYKEHPEFFAARKQFAMNELVIAAGDLNPALLGAADGAASLDEIAAWLDAHQVKYGRGQVTRSTADVPPPLASKLQGLPKGRPLLIKDGTRAVFIAVLDTRDAPVPLAAASGQIAQFLVSRRNKELAAAELQRLRSGARIEYLNKAMMPDATPAAEQPAAAPAVAGVPVADAAATDRSALDRGVAGLR